MKEHLKNHRDGFGLGFTPITTLGEDNPSAISLGVLRMRAGEKLRLPVARETAWLLMDGAISGDIDGQIYMRDFKLIDQSDMICSLVPELPGGVPGLSSGVERELQHAWEHTKEVYVVWKPKKNPSPNGY